MKLARVIRTGGAWVITGPYSIVDRPPVGTIVQYEPIINGGVRYVLSRNTWARPYNLESILGVFRGLRR